MLGSTPESCRVTPLCWELRVDNAGDVGAVVRLSSVARGGVAGGDEEVERLPTFEKPVSSVPIPLLALDFDSLVLSRYKLS